nr:hypothetical protein [Tanacetum cinerariifolium]
MKRRLKDEGGGGNMEVVFGVSFHSFNFRTCDHKVLRGVVRRRSAMGKVSRLSSKNWYGGLSWSHGAKGKDSFVKCDMTGNDDFVGVQVKAPISIMIVKVPEKDRWCGARGKFMRWKGVRVTNASKCVKVGVRVLRPNTREEDELEREENVLRY